MSFKGAGLSLTLSIALSSIGGCHHSPGVAEHGDAAPSDAGLPDGGPSGADGGPSADAGWANGLNPQVAALLMASCQNQAQCQGVSLEACLTGESAPLLYASFGTTAATFAAVAAGKATLNSAAFAACLTAIQTQSCGTNHSWAYDMVEWPPCNEAVVGLVGAGGHCISSEECAPGLQCSRSVTTNPDLCAGTCAKVPPCVRNSDCDAGMVCLGGTYGCAASVPSGGEDEPCGTGIACQTGLNCIDTVSGTGQGSAICAKLPTSGQSCTNIGYCNPYGASCGPGADGGQFCSSVSQLDGGCQSNSGCAAGLFCDVTSMTCQASPSSGPCAPGDVCDSNVAFCNTQMTPPSCVPYEDGGPCTSAAQCGGPLDVGVTCWMGVCQPNSFQACTP